MFEDSHWQKYSSRFRTLPSILDDKEGFNGMIVCIPVLAEPALISTLESLLECDMPPVRVEVIILFNKNVRMTEEESVVHTQTWNECLRWIDRKKGSSIPFKPIKIDSFPDPKGGVGWARKVVMDEAARKLGDEGIIVCLDADCLVAGNYLTTIYGHFQKQPLCNAFSIYYEHDLDALDPFVRSGIVQYELHLRYLVHVMRWAGHPFAFQTVGSAMAVRRRAYLAQGGMNTRQAGEDFYFLQKFIELNSLGEINETVVYPSARISNRVPFGTGRAMQKLLGESPEWFTTSFEIFSLIRPLLQNVEMVRTFIQEEERPDAYVRLKEMINLDDGILPFLQSIDFIPHCRKVFEHTSSPASFKQRFFRYFNGFMMIRYMHFMRDQQFPDVPVVIAAQVLAGQLNLITKLEQDPEELLQLFRKLDKGGR
ncbi:MAG: glycosyltransferase family 2 protein [Saprospiraceae bacterium]|nr:glycosyltransferase family 2 protein [Saprospiraceae bacterium]